jgi:hypothetical protein
MLNIITKVTQFCVLTEFKPDVTVQWLAILPYIPEIPGAIFFPEGYCPD